MRPSPVRILRRDVPAHGPWPDSVPTALQRIYAARGVLTPADGELKLARLLPPDALGQLPQAAVLLADAIAGGKHIVVVGDFDCAIRTPEPRSNVAFRRGKSISRCKYQDAK